MLEAIDSCIRRDPGRRGLISSEPQFGPLCPGDLAAAARSLAESATHVAIVTGFFIPRGDPPSAETDGPPGALILAIALRGLGCGVTLITDNRCRNAVDAAARACGFSEQSVRTLSDDQTAEDFLNALPSLSHLIAIERVGPSHTVSSLRAQTRDSEDGVLADFERLVPSEHMDHCHNMRGEIIDEYTAGTHRLFEVLPRVYPSAKSIGIGDGGNELGMGRIPWEELTRRLNGPPCLPCRIATDWTIVAGTSNWGGSALAAAVVWIRERTDLLKAWDADHEQAVIRAMVEQGPAVDGVTRQREATVDGLPFLTYIQPWLAIREKIGLPEHG